jgi:type IV pilus assembly protein PilV
MRNMDTCPLTPDPWRAQSGLSLLEVLVTIVVISLGILGVSGLQVTGMKNSYGALLRAQAAQYAYDMTDRMRVNRAAAVKGEYNLIMDDPKPTGTSLPKVDLAGWLTQLERLPDGDGAVTVTPAGVATITVRWSEAALGGSTAQLTVVTEL